MDSNLPPDEYGCITDELTEFYLTAKNIDGRKYSEQDSTEEIFYSTANGNNGETLLHLLCRQPMQDEALKYISSALINGADPNARDHRGRTPLHEICLGDYGHAISVELDVINLLIRSGALIDIQDDNGMTPLLFSTLFIRDQWDDDDPTEVDGITERLISLGAGVNIPNIDWITPLHVAVAHNDLPMTKLLCQRGASPHVRTRGTSTLYNKRLILLDNHSGVAVPLGSRPSDICQSVVMKNLLQTFMPIQQVPPTRSP